MKKYLLPFLGLLLVINQAFAETTPATRPATSRQAFATSTKTTVASSPNPSTVGASVTFTASVVDDGFSFPLPIVNEGTVTFSEGATVLAANVTVTNGAASFTTSALAVGVHAITAVYSGTTNFGTSTGSMAQTVDGSGPCPTYTGNIAYVNASATVGTNDGTNWARAFLTLQEALDAARTCGVTQIWVAQGTYLPTTYPIGAATSTSFGGGTLSSTDFSFHLVDGVAIYGGFSGSGTETQLSQRNWRQYPTILSGSNARNHVVTSANDGLATRLDGFTITGGRANGTILLTVEGQSFGGSNGGGMVLNSSSPTLSNLLISGNSCPATDFSGGSGGGMVMNGGASVLTNVAFVGNSAYSGGGLSASSAFTMTNCVFSGNTANAGGGGMIVGGASPTLTNVVFANNAATRTVGFTANGGAMINNGGVTTLVNCTFFGNSATGGGGVMYNVNLTTVRDLNGIYYGNSAPTSPDVYKNPNSFDTSTFTSTTALFGTDPKFVNSADPDGPDNQWMTADDGLALQSTSPAINAGTLAGAPTTDILGATRTGNPDQGAYEYNPCTNPTAFALTGGGSLCTGGSGVAIGLGGSETGVSYQLKRDGTNVGGAVSGTGSALGFGTFTTAGTYTVLASRDGTACTATMTGSATVTVNPLPEVSITGLPSSFCKNAVALTLTGSPAGGSFTIDGTPATSFDPSTLSVGPHSVVYAYTNPTTSCSASASQTVTVNALPTVSLSALAATYCQSAPASTPGTPAGGSYSIDGGQPVSSFDPASLSLGPHSVVYTYTDPATTCPASATQSVNIVTLEFSQQPNVAQNLTVCANGSLTFSFNVTCLGNATFTAQLSDASGSFANPVSLGTVSPGSNTVLIPAGTPGGEGYRVRVVGQNPALTSDRTRAFTVTALSVAQYPTTPSRVCQQSDALPVTFSTRGNCAFPQDNVFTVQLSNAVGSFVTPLVLGTAQPGTTTFPATLLNGLPPGTGYRVRIVTSNPATTSSASLPFRLEAPSLSVTPTVSGSTVCRGQAVSLTFQLPANSCPFFEGNVFTAQLSSASGSFNNPVSLGVVQAGVPNSVTIPATASAGTGYRIRIVSSSPVATSLSSAALRVNATGCTSRRSAEEAELVVVPNPVVGGAIRVRVSGMDTPAFNLMTSAGRNVGLLVKTDGSGEFVLTPRQSLPTGVYVLGASEGQTRLTRRVLVSE